MKEAGKCLRNEQIPEGQYGTLSHSTRPAETYIVTMTCACDTYFLMPPRGLLCFVLLFQMWIMPDVILLTACVCLCVLCAVQYKAQRCRGRPPTQHVAEYGQGYVQGNPGLLAGSGQGCEPGCLCEANIILPGVFGVRHILLHLPPPSLLVLKTLRIKTLNIHLQQTPAESTFRYFFDKEYLLPIYWDIPHIIQLILMIQRAKKTSVLKEQLVQQADLWPGHQNASFNGSLQEEDCTLSLLWSSHQPGPFASTVDSLLEKQFHTTFHYRQAHSMTLCVENPRK